MADWHIEGERLVIRSECPPVLNQFCSVDHDIEVVTGDRNGRQEDRGHLVPTRGFEGYDPGDLLGHDLRGPSDPLVPAGNSTGGPPDGQRPRSGAECRGRRNRAGHRRL